MDVETRKRGVKAHFDDATKLRMVLFYIQGQSFRQVGSRFGCTDTTARAIVRSFGVEPRKKTDHLKGNKNGWKGGRSVKQDGYVLVHKSCADEKFHCMAREPNGYIAEHRLVVAKHLDRALTKAETVHHIDGDRGNNDILNLQLRHSQHGPGIVMCCCDCGSINVSAVGV